MDERVEKLRALLETEDIDQIFTESIEETQANLQARGIEFSIDELKELAKTVSEDSNKEELNEGALDDVTGGAGLCWAIPWIVRYYRPKLLPKISKW